MFLWRSRGPGCQLAGMAFALGVFWPGGLGAASTLTVVDVVQDDASAVVSVAYTLADAPAVVTIDIQTNAGPNAWVSIGGARQRHWAGDVNRLLRPDAEKVRMATWAAAADWPGFRLTDGVRAEVRAWPQDDLPDCLVVDLVAASNVCYYLNVDFLPGGVTNDLYKTDRMALRRIPAANVVWLMGSPGSEPQRAASETLQPVKLTADYYMGVYPVTQRQWVRVLGGSSPANWRSASDHWLHPVESVTWNEIGSASMKRGMRGGDWIRDGHDGLGDGTFLDVLRKRTGVKFDLPTSAQWEYACRAGTMTALYTGVTPKFTTFSDAEGKSGNWSEATDAVGWSYHNSGEDPVFGGVAAYGSHAVGQKAPNAWGLYDMLGNTWDICLDWYSSTARDGTLKIDPVGPPTKGTGEFSGHVWRGGDSCVHNYGSYLRAARFYSYGDEDAPMSCTGLRVVCPVPLAWSLDNREGEAQ